MRALLPMALVIFFLGPWLPRAMASGNIDLAEERFHCGLLGACMADFKAIRILANDMVPIMKELSRSPIAQATAPSLRGRIVALQQALGNCNQDVLGNCKIDLSRVRPIILEKVKFLTNSAQQPDFAWSEENKKLYIDALLRKLCSGAISTVSIESIDAILFWNTSCTGNAYLKELSPFSQVRGIGSLRGDNVCVNGKNTQTIITSDGNKYQANYLIVASNTRIAGWYNEERVVDQLDETLVHEFVHRQRDVDSKFKQRTDEFLSLRFKRLQTDYLQASDKAEEDINAESDRIANIPGLTDEQRNGMISKFAKSRMSQFKDWLVSAKIPIRAGMASINGVWAVDQASNQQPGQFTVQNIPTFNNGNPTQFKFVDWARAIPRNATGRPTVQLLDSYSLFDEEEYVAVSLAMYRYDRPSSLRSFSKDELQWLENNWEAGYLQNQ